MKFTNRQALLIANVHRISVRQKMSGKHGFFLMQEDCTTTINSLIVKRVVARTPDGRGVVLTKRVGMSA